MGVTTALNPADDRGRIIDKNIEEIEDESIGGPKFIYEL